MTILERKIKEKLEKKLATQMRNNSKICIACSSGLDSTALFQLLIQISKEFKTVKLSIAHVNYGLRDQESDLDESFLSNIAKKYDVPFFVYRPKKTQKTHREKIGVQAWARLERYQFFDSIVVKGWDVALAHTEDDLFENILLRISRGTSPLAVKGMSEFHGSFWRPLLSIKKKELKSWLCTKNYPWREDETNASLAYSRNKIRLNVIPELDHIYTGAGQRIIRFANQSHDLAVFAKKALEKRLEEHRVQKTNCVTVELEFFLGLNQGVSCLFLAEILRNFTRNKYTPEHKVLIALYDWICENPEVKPQKQLSKDIFCKIHQNKLVFTR